MTGKVYDVAIVGAGPAGLSAALYAARFCRSTLVVHDGRARAARIPLTHNAPGFDSGVSGPDLLDRMMCHAMKYGAEFVEAHISVVDRRSEMFELFREAGPAWRARALILATGLELNQIPLDHQTHEEAIRRGVLRYCPICDGYEHRNKRIGVIGCDISGASEALFLRTFSADVTLLPHRENELSKAERADLIAAGVRTVARPIQRYVVQSSSIQIFLSGASMPLEFDVVYPALGCRPRNGLARSLGLGIDLDGKVEPTAPFGTAVGGLYAAGDLVEGLDQISVAIGHGAIAATKAHNWLRSRDGETVEAIFDREHAQ